MSDWALGKKLNSQIADAPLNCMIIADNLQTFGDASFFYSDKQFVESLATNKLCVNMPSISERICLESIKNGLGDTFVSLLNVDSANRVAKSNSCFSAILQNNLLGRLLKAFDDVGYGYDYLSINSVSDFEHANWLANYFCDMRKNGSMSENAFKNIIKNGIDFIEKNENAIVLNGSVDGTKGFTTNVYNGEGLAINGTFTVTNNYSGKVVIVADGSSYSIDSPCCFSSNVYGKCTFSSGVSNSHASLKILCLKKMEV